MNFPRMARITESRWRQYGYCFSEMGLSNPEFRALDGNNGQVVVDPANLTRSKDRPFTVRRDFIEFLEES